VVTEAAQYGLTCEQIVLALVRAVRGSVTEEVSPQLARQFDEFLRTVGVPINEVMDLLQQTFDTLDPRDEWGIEDLQTMVSGYARGNELTVAQSDELRLMVRRVHLNAVKRQRQKQRLDALVRQARGYPDGDVQ
jgi:hypothetical protein